MTSDVQKKIAGLELRFPYFDKGQLQAIGDSSDRYHIATIGTDEQLAEKYNLDPKRPPDLIAAQIMAGIYVREQFKERNIRPFETCQLTGIDNATISRNTNGVRPFSLMPSFLTPFCYNVLQESCHKVMFGEEGRIDLPKPYSMTARSLLSLDEPAREALLKYAQKKAEVYDSQCKETMQTAGAGKKPEAEEKHAENKREKADQNMIPNAPRRDQLIIIRERIQTYLDDTGRRPVHFLGTDTPHVVRNIIRRLMLDIRENPTPRGTILMYLSFETGLALDYFIAEDFTKYVPCFYTDENGEKIELKDKRILQYLGTCAALPPETREQLMGRAIGSALAAM